MDPLNKRKEALIHYLKELRDTIIASFEELEPHKRFERTSWDHKKGSGGGEMSVLRGEVFEKAAVNWSAITGPQFPMQDGSGPFFATGVSLITHMMNPFAPTVHFNIRYIETEQQSWFGGGYDLTPMGFEQEEDTTHFHATAKKALDDLDPHLYPIFSEEAKQYFYIPHRQKERGIGGIFFDHFNTGNFANDLKLWKTVGDTFLQAIIPIYQKRVPLPFTDRDKQVQHQLRAHYAEFNLVYDRGTKFGLLSGGNTEAILCSMPPVATW